MRKYIILFLGVLCTFLIVRYFYFNRTLVFGDQAPEINELDFRGNEISLANFKDNYLLLNFWGSWCMPCRKENKIIAMLYDRYKNVKFKQAQGIKFLSVALENKVEPAEIAIKSDALIWPDHIILTNMLESPLAKKYGIKQVPAILLIGPDSRIILSNPDVKELDDYLAHNLLKN
ncbi:MAG: TlpA disulfide reductase family protein [Saprospiraceae bacterium]